MNCTHDQFAAKVNVHKTTADGKTLFNAEVSVKCAICGLAFVVANRPGSLSPDRTKLIVPIEPEPQTTTTDASPSITF